MTMRNRESVQKFGVIANRIVDCSKAGGGPEGRGRRLSTFRRVRAPPPHPARRIRPAPHNPRRSPPCVVLTLKIVFTDRRVFTPNPNSEPVAHCRFPCRATENLIGIPAISVKSSGVVRHVSIRGQRQPKDI